MRLIEDVGGAGCEANQRCEGLSVRLIKYVGVAWN